VVALQRGKLVSEHPEEEAKQKNIKSLLNKVTPEKYMIIRDKLLAVNIDSPFSLSGLIDQVPPTPTPAAGLSFARCFAFSDPSPNDCTLNFCITS